MSVSEPIPVLDHGFVILEKESAEDLDVVNGARVSLGKRSEEMGKSEVGLVRFLMREKHTSPFEQTFLKFHVRAPLFVSNQWARHRMGSFNFFSLRYADATEDFYVPNPEDVRTQVGKPGAYTFESVTDQVAVNAITLIQGAYDYSYKVYLHLLEQGVAREVARIVMPLGAYTEFIWSVNARSLLHFLNLRNSPHAQREIRFYAEALEGIFAKQMPVTYEAWVENGRDL